MMDKRKSSIFFVLMDALIIAASYGLSYFIVVVTKADDSFIGLWQALGPIIVAKILVFFLFRVYRMIPRFFDFRNIAKIGILSISTNLIIVLLLWWGVVPSFMHKSIYLFISSFEVAGLVAYRLVMRVGRYIKYIERKADFTSKKTIIIGAGSAGEMALQEYIRNKELNNYIVGFLDDDKDKIGRSISNIVILGRIDELRHFILDLNVDEVLMAIKDYSKKGLQNILETLNEFPHVKFKRINLISDVDQNESLKIMDVKIEDLLEREVINLDNDGIFEFIEGETVLVTGGGGSIGSELCRQVFNLKPKKLVIFDLYENNAYDIQMELERLKFKNKDIDVELVTLIGSVYNKERLEQVFKEQKPTIIFHAAAYKHVPLMEDSPVEAIRTNVIGTYNTAFLADKYHVKKMVLVSSDKAVRSTNVMGATKRYAEMVIGYFNANGRTKYSAVRFGNVLGSNGSVIPLFKRQLEDGGPLTVTHKDITRYFMTIPEAVGLILQSAVYASGGEIFILDMGEPVKIYDLAEKMIMLSGYKPNVDIKIEVVGLRPGEKLYEELLVDRDNNDFLTTDHSRIFIEPAEPVTYSGLDLDYIIKNYEKMDNQRIKGMLAHVVTSYQINGDKNV